MRGRRGAKNRAGRQGGGNEKRGERGEKKVGDGVWGGKGKREMGWKRKGEVKARVGIEALRNEKRDGKRKRRKEGVEERVGENVVGEGRRITG